MKQESSYCCYSELLDSKRMNISQLSWFKLNCLKTLFCNLNIYNMPWEFKAESKIIQKARNFINTSRQTFACSFWYPKPFFHTLHRCPFCRHSPGNNENLVGAQNFYKFCKWRTYSFHMDQISLFLRSKLYFHSAFFHHFLWYSLHRLSMYLEW